ncbi:MAG: hypothetical protein PHP89_07000, partial [Candidatus Omnitrophica bacterium]|nr:hypothetical protein [Candidatus Omnitrophota bacterium]
FNAKLGWDIKENKPVVLFSTQNNNGSIRPYANINSTGENTTLQAGTRFDRANGYHFDASGLMDSNSNFGASIDVGTSSVSLRTTAYEDNNYSFGVRVNPFKLFDRLVGAKQYSGMGIESYKPQGNILFAEPNTALGEFRGALRRALLAKDNEISLKGAILGLFSKGSVEQMAQDLEKLGAKVTQQQVKEFLAIKEAFDKENVKLFPGKFSELMEYMIRAKELTTENGSKIRDYIYNGNAKAALDISRSLDLWELVYFAGLIKEHGDDYAKKTLSRYVRIKKEVGVFLGKGFNPANENDVRAIRFFNSLSENTRNAEEFIAKLQGGLIEAVAKLYEFENKGKKLDLSGDEGLEALNFWLISIEKNGGEAKDDIQILKNTLVLMQRGASREEALARAKLIHEAMFKKRIQNYPENRLSKILDIEKVVGSLEVAIDLSSLIKYETQNENLQKAWELMKAYQAKPYYKYLIYMQYVSFNYDGSFRELLPYIFQAEEAARYAEVELDFAQSSRDFRMLNYWAKRARELEQEGAKDVIAKLRVAFLDKNNFRTFLKDNAVLDNYLRGKDILGEVQGENKKMLENALGDAKAFLKIALNQSGVVDANKYLARINAYKFVATGLVNEKANNGTDTIYIPYAGYLTERNNVKLAQLLVHEISALWGVKHSNNTILERSFERWIENKKPADVTLPDVTKNSIKEEVGKENKDKHQDAGGSTDPFQPGTIEYQLVQQSPFLELFGVTSYQDWVTQYGSNTTALNYVGGRAADVTRYYGGNVSAYIIDLDTKVQELSYALNNASVEAQNLFATAFGQQVQQLSWQSTLYMAALFDAIGSPSWQGVTNFIAGFNNIISFENSWANSAYRDQINSNIMSLFGINLSNGVDRAEIERFFSERYGLLYDEKGIARNSANALAFYGKVVEFINRFNASPY